MALNWNELLREKVNETSFVLAKYQNNASKDQWGCICSAMDWLDVGMANIETTLDELKNSKGLETCMKFYQYICCIDIVWESICQLHRVFVNPNPKTIPFKNESNIFSREIFNKDDNDYFKEIRACFGAHSVNLNSGQKLGIKFASWSTNFGNPQTMSILLYSNIPGDKYIQLNVTIDQLQRFYESRCQYIQVILNAIDSNVLDYVNDMKNSIITKSNNCKDQIEILKSEARKRYGGHVLIEELEQIEHFLSTQFCCKKNEVAIEQFRKRVVSGIDEIYTCLQNMSIDYNLDIEVALSPKYKPRKDNFGDNFSSLYLKTIPKIWKVYDAKSIKRPLEKYICFEYKTEDELYWLTIIALNLAQEDLKRENDQNNIDLDAILDCVNILLNTEE